MIWVGVTGGIGCGKSTVISFFKKLGFSVVSADQIVKDLYLRPEVVAEVSRVVGIEVSTFSKEKVATAVFADKTKLRLLEECLHPLVRVAIENKKKSFEAAGESLAFYEVPLLFEKNMQSGFDCTLCIGAEKEVQVRRIKNRNTWSDTEIEQRLEAQLPLADKKKLADFYIDNSGDLKTLEKLCSKAIEQISESVLELKK